jgi:hypothetical protein
LQRECVCTHRHIGIIGITLVPIISKAKSMAYITSAYRHRIREFSPVA